MCSPGAPKKAPVVAPPPPAELARPLGVDDDEGASGIASLRTSGRNGLGIAGRRTGTATGAGRGLTIGGGNSTSGQTRPAPPSRTGTGSTTDGNATYGGGDDGGDGADGGSEKRRR